jgi:hypothetical protein
LEANAISGRGQMKDSDIVLDIIKRRGPGFILSIIHHRFPDMRLVAEDAGSDPYEDHVYCVVCGDCIYLKFTALP